MFHLLAKYSETFQGLQVDQLSRKKYPEFGRTEYITSKL